MPNTTHSHDQDEAEIILDACANPDTPDYSDLAEQDHDGAHATGLVGHCPPCGAAGLTGFVLAPGLAPAVTWLVGLRRQPLVWRG